MTERTLVHKKIFKKPGEVVYIRATSSSRRLDPGRSLEPRILIQEVRCLRAFMFGAAD